MSECMMWVVDCVGDWTGCDANCLNAYFITTPAENGGNSCPYTNEYTITCSPGDGLCPLPGNQGEKNLVCSQQLRILDDKVIPILWNNLHEKKHFEIFFVAENRYKIRSYVEHFLTHRKKNHRTRKFSYIGNMKSFTI